METQFLNPFFFFLTVLLFKLMKVTLKITSLFHICYVNVLEKEKKLDLAYNDAGKFPVMIKKKIRILTVTVDKLRRSSGTEGLLLLLVSDSRY